MINVTTGDIVPAATIRNTAGEPELNAMLAVANMMGRTDGDPMSNLILGQEADGQRQLVNSARLPTESGNSDEEFAAVGVILGPPDEHDPLFRPATLPAGWKRQGTDHSMHSKVVDQYGRERISVFYKAAFYDRRADMCLVTPAAYLRGLVWNDGGDPILGDEWLTPAVAVETLITLEQHETDQAVQADGYAAQTDNPRIDPEYWTGRAAEHRAEAAKYASMRTRIEAAS